MMHQKKGKIVDIIRNSTVRTIRTMGGISWKSLTLVIAEVNVVMNFFRIMTTITLAIETKEEDTVSNTAKYDEHE